MPAEGLLPSEPYDSLDDYLRSGGGDGIDTARRLGREATIEVVAASGLRGRGGGAFPTGRKWRSVADAAGTRRYAVCNAAEGEPATFKDRALLRADPYSVVEGLAIAAIAVGADEAYIALKASFARETDRVGAAVAELGAAGLLGDLSVGIVTGPEEYLFGEEKALLEVIEGNDPLPRLLPPYVHGLWATAPQSGWESHAAEPGRVAGAVSNPTLVDNVETLANVPRIVAGGADRFRRTGTAASPGTAVCTVVGDVLRPGVVEVAMGTPLQAVLDACGGTPAGRSVKAVFPGVANAVVTADHLDVHVSYEGFEAIGSGLGAAGFVVYDDTTSMVEVAHLFSRFLYVESCGQCPACKFGTGETTAYLARLLDGHGDAADLERIAARLRSVTDGNRCFLPVEDLNVVSSLLAVFPDEFAACANGVRPSLRDLQIPKIVDIADGVVTYDARQRHKRPDWTYG